MFTLKDKVCLITGSYGYLASNFIKDIIKFEPILILTGRNNDKLKKQFNELNTNYKNIYMLQLDVTNKKNINEVITFIEKKFNCLDVIINNSNYYNDIKSFEDKNSKDITDSFTNNVVSVYNLLTLSIPLLIKTAKERSVSIINFSSLYGSFSPKKEIYPNLESVNPIEYGLAKASIHQMTKYFAGYYGDRNIRFNTITPGCFPNVNKVKDKEFLENLKKKSPMNRIGIPNDLSGIIIFLASDASSFITGQNIFIDGGANCWL